MGMGNATAFQDAVTAISSTQLYPIGTIRYETNSNGLMCKYEYNQADDALTQYDAVAVDIAGSATGLKVTRASSAGQLIKGFAQVAVTDEYFFWLQVGGHGSGTIKNGVAAGEPLTGTSTAGAAGQATEAGSGAYKVNDGWTAFTANSSGGDATREVYKQL